MKQFATRQEAVSFGRKEGWTTLFYGSLVLDATLFVHSHPGGSHYLLDHLEQDIKPLFNDPLVHRHEPLSIHTLANLAKGCVGSEAEEVPSQWYDPKEALVPQIMRMSHDRYKQAIDEPFHYGSPRMFQSSFFQMFSHNKWHTILILHGILHLYFFSLALGLGLELSFRCLPVYLGSILIWGFLQYLIHRFLFHSEDVLPDGPYWRLFHFTLHGIHHMIPMDPDRLVFPPVLGLVIAYLIGFKAFLPLGPWGLLVFMGAHLGYVLYDMTHYFLHHSSGKDAFSFIRRYHAQHHYRGQAKGFGVSYPFWDLVFGTQL